MADVEFVIPLKRDDLQVSIEGQYYVANVMSGEEILDKLKECTSDVINHGSVFILKHFDLLYSVMLEFGALDWEDIHKIHDRIIFKSISMLSKFVEEALENSEDRLQSLNIVKMTFYIYCQFFQCYMNKMSIKTESTATINVKGRKKKNINDQHTEEYSWDWEDKQRSGLVKVETTLQLQLCNLWDPPVVEETFVNMIADCCYKALEQPSISLIKSKILKDSIIRILGLLIKQYNHGMSFVVKSVQLMKRFEHVATPLVEAVLKYITQFGIKALVKHLIEEIIEASETLSNVTDNHSAKSFSSFLTELAQGCPHEFVPHLDSVLSFLDSELPTLRSLGLCVLTEMILECLSLDDADKEEKNKRETCLETLTDHLLDVNAHVRAKVLQLWQKIVAHGSLPKDWIIPLMESATERIMDVSSIVTKQAVHLIRLMMETNPFAAMLSIDELTKTLEDEVEIYKQMKKSKLNTFPNNKEKLWSTVEPELKAFLEEYFKEGSNYKAPPESPDLKKNRITTISLFLSERNYKKAVNLLIYAEDTLCGFKDLRKGIQMSDVDFYLGVFRSIFFDNQNIMLTHNSSTHHDSASGELALATEEDNEKNEEIKTALANQKSRVCFYSDCVKFVKCLNTAMEKVVKLLSSKQVFDVVEAIEFVKTSKQFGISGSDSGIIVMMKLVNCPEESIRSCATRALEQLYFQTNQKEVTSPADIGYQVVSNLSGLLRSMKLSEEDNLNTLMKEWIKNSSINSYCIAAMIDIFSLEHPNSTPDDSLPALILFSIVVQSQPSMVNDYLDVLVRKGLTRSRKRSKHKDLRVARYVLEILKQATSKHPSKRFPNDNRIFAESYNSIVEHFLDFTESNYLYMVESAIDLWFVLSLKPELLCVKLLQVIHKLIVKHNSSTSSRMSESSKLSEMTNTTTEITSEISHNLEENTNQKVEVKQEALVRLIFIVGHIALRLCLYLEQDVLEERKERSRIDMKEKAQLKQANKKDDDADDELNMAVDIVAANDDALAETIRLICENEILYGQGLIAKYTYLPVTVLKEEGKYNNLRLKSVASISLGQFMMVSKKFCSENIQFLITVLEKTSEAVVKNNIVILFGELLLRYPNVIEPWISYLYSRLRDPCNDVRHNTLLVISHLITNEMVKVKAQISEVALCIVDTDEEIKENATRLFHELSVKGNALYNVLPDIISTLSNPEASNPLTEEDFQKILRYLIELIQKEKQMEYLIEKLCIRLRASESERQWSDLCFCLSLFSYSERSLRKIIDYFQSSFSSKLHCTAVYNCLTGIITTASRSTKPGVKESASELSEMLEETGKTTHSDNNDVNDADEKYDRTSCLDDEANETNKRLSKLRTPQTCRKGARSSTVKKPARATTSRKGSTKSDSDSEHGSKGISVKKVKSTAKKRKPIKYESDSDEGSADEFTLPKSQPNRPIRSTRRKLVIDEDGDSSNNSDE